MHAMTRSFSPEMIAAWRAVCERSLVPVAVQSPEWLLAKQKALATDDTEVDILAATSSHLEDDSLLAVAALTRVGLRQGFPMPCAISWDAGFIFSGMPLLEQSRADEALLALLTEAQQRFRVPSVLLRKVPLQGKFAELLETMSSKGEIRYSTFAAHERAALFCGQNYEEWLKSNFSKKRRHEFRRRRNRLEECGKVDVSLWQSGEDLRPWIDQFVALEVSGWKGQRGTATGCNPAHVSFMHDALTALAARESLLFWRITLDDEPVAMLFAFGQQQSICLGKTAYREDLSHFSPGVMLMLEATRYFLDESSAVSVDSAADAKHPLMDYIWSGRMAVGDVLIAIPGTTDRQFAAACTAETIRRKTRETAKIIYNKVLRR
jgi:CelD/BcsL family acetyltransferase involved in cellulose biosynthesis